MNFSNSPSEEEMSMEDILSSIRKYVSEEDEKRNTPSSSNTSETGMDAFSNINSTNNMDSVIKLDESNIVSPESTKEVISTPVNTEQPITYEEKSSLSKNVHKEEKPIKKSPFGQLADALTSYGKKSSEQKTNSPTVDQFFTAIAENVIEKWVNENLHKLVEKIVLREIEKMKSED